tara:strand:+ start:2922 stop:3098 length:177 start_codon:yes stop_codon:yes gene_type:complete
MTEVIGCPHCESDNVDQFLNNNALWHCNTCGEMWEVLRRMEYLQQPKPHREPMEGVSV